MTQVRDRRALPSAARMLAPLPRTGVGRAQGHHGELLQGLFRGADGRRTRALVTMPHPGIGSRATFRAHGDWITVGDNELTKVLRAARLTLDALPSAATGGHVEITSDVPRGLGLGSSTSDVTATIRAVADAHGVMLTQDDVARLAMLAEGACDSVMIEDRVVLFAHREGRAVETLGQRLPPMVVVGCDTAPGISVDTLRHPRARYDEDEIAAFRVLLAAMRRAISGDDVVLLGKVATASARINQRFLPTPHWEFLLALCRAEHGCGVQVAHSGTVAGVILDPRRPGVATSIQRCLDRIRHEGLEPTAVIRTDAVPVALDESA